jgi:hypothetical protein
MLFFCRWNWELAKNKKQTFLWMLLAQKACWLFVHEVIQYVVLCSVLGLIDVRLLLTAVRRRSEMYGAPVVVGAQKKKNNCCKRCCCPPCCLCLCRCWCLLVLLVTLVIPALFVMEQANKIFGPGGGDDGPDDETMSYDLFRNAPEGNNE